MADEKTGTDIDTGAGKDFYSEFVGDGGIDAALSGGAAGEAGSEVQVPAGTFANENEQLAAALEGEANAIDAGQTSGSQADNADQGDKLDQQGQEKTPASPADGSEGKIKTEASEADTSTADKGTDGKPLPFDKDPKWIAARAAEKSLQDLLAQSGYANTEELVDALDRGADLTKKIGDKDPEKLVEDSEYLKKVQAHWDEQRAKELEENEAPEDTIKRLKSEKATILDQHTLKEADQVAAEGSAKALTTYNDAVSKMVDAEEGGDPEKQMLKELLGVNNPAIDVDIDDPREVKRMAASSINRFQDFVKAIRQSAVDEYAAGKSKVTPISKTATGAETKTVVKATVPKNASVDDTFAAGKAELLELLTSAATENM